MKLKIVINTNNRIKSIYADDETNEFTIGDVIITRGISTFIQSSLTLIKEWPDKIVSENKDLPISYKIAYDDGTESKQISAEGEFPKDFHKLANLIYSYEDPIAFKSNQIMMEKGDF